MNLVTYIEVSFGICKTVASGFYQVRYIRKEKKYDDQLSTDALSCSQYDLIYMP